MYCERVGCSSAHAIPMHPTWAQVVDEVRSILRDASLAPRTPRCTANRTWPADDQVRGMQWPADACLRRVAAAHRASLAALSWQLLRGRRGPLL